MTRIPYTPLLLVTGIILGGYTDKLGVFGQGLEIILGIDPHGILLIFIPILVFEAAYNTDLYFFKKEFYQVLTLAGPGVAVGAIFLAVVFNYILGYSEEFNIYGALTFGAIACATDTVAVLALLKELGTPKYFSCLFEGENLLNDATAMVFYMIFSNLFKAKGITAMGAIVQFLRLSVGGLVLGGSVFLVVMMWLRKITKDKILVITITIISCYLTFFLAESVFQVSGLLSVVVLGVLLAMYSKMRLTPETSETVHIVISFVCYCLESILFLITGVFIGKMFVFENQNTLVPEDYTKSVIFFVFMNIARYLMILILFPLINKSGYPINWKDAIILSYGGMRGALGLALGLIIYKDDDYSPRFSDIVLFYVAGMIVMTVIFNGLTIGYVMKLINFSPKNPLSIKIMNNVKMNIVISVYNKSLNLKENKFLNLANWDEVKNSCGIKGLIEEQLKFNQSEKTKREDRKQDEIPLTDLNVPLRERDFDQMEVHEVRLRILNMMKALIFSKFEEDFCSINVLKSLNESCEVCLEDLSRPIWLWEEVSQELLSVEQIMTLNRIRKIPLIGRFTGGYLSRFFLDTYEKLCVMVMCLNELLDEKPEIPLNLHIVEMVYKEIHMCKAKFESRRFYLCDLFPDFITIVQNKQASQILLNTQKSVIQNSYEDGYITEDDYERMTNIVEKEISHLDIKSFNWSTKDINELELIEPSFSKLNKEFLQLIRDNIKPDNFQTGSHIYSKGDLVKGLHVLIRGMAEDNLTLDYKMTLGVGAVVSFANIVSADNRCVSTLVCLKDCATYFIPKEIILEIIEKDPEFSKYIYRSALYYYLKIFGSISYNQSLNDAMISTLVETCEIVIKKGSEVVCIDGGGFLFKGVMRPMAVETVSGFSPIAEEKQHLDNEENEYIAEKADSVHSPHTLSPDMKPKKSAYQNSPRSQILAPMLINPLMTGYYKVIEPVVFCSFKNSGISEEKDRAGSSKFSIRNNKGSIRNTIGGGSRLRSLDVEDIEKVFNELVENNFPEIVEQMNEAKNPSNQDKNKEKKKKTQKSQK